MSVKNLLDVNQKIISTDVGQKNFGRHRPKNNPDQCWLKKTLTNVNQKIVSTDDSLKITSINVIQNNSRRDRPKNNSYRSW